MSGLYFTYSSTVKDGYDLIHIDVSNGGPENFNIYGEMRLSLRWTPTYNIYEPSTNVKSVRLDNTIYLYVLPKKTVIPGWDHTPGSVTYYIKVSPGPNHSGGSLQHIVDYVNVNGLDIPKK